MLERLLRIAAPALISLAPFAPPATAADTFADTHAYLEAERSRTDGQPWPQRLAVAQRAPGNGAHAVESPQDRAFRARLAQTDGNVDPHAAEAAIAQPALASHRADDGARLDRR